MYENYLDTEGASYLIVPIDLLDLWKRYRINIRTGCVYDDFKNAYVLPYHKDNGELYVLLESETSGKVDAQLSMLLNYTIFGYTNSGATSKCTRFPCNPSEFSPSVNTVRSIDRQHLKVNDIDFYRWKDTPYFLNTQGTIYSSMINQFMRRNYNEKGYLKLAIKNPETRKTMTFRVHRMVWETFRGPIPEDKEINHIDGRRYNNRLENLQLMSHLENLQQKSDENHPALSDEAWINLFKQVSDGVPKKKIAKEFGITYEYLTKILTRKVIPKRFDESDIVVPDNPHRDRNISDDLVREIRRRKENGESYILISTDLGLNYQAVRNICKRITYADVD